MSRVISLQESVQSTESLSYPVTCYSALGLYASQIGCLRGFLNLPNKKSHFTSLLLPTIITASQHNTSSRWVLINVVTAWGKKRKRCTHTNTHKHTQTHVRIKRKLRFSQRQKSICSAVLYSHNAGGLLLSRATCAPHSKNAEYPREALGLVSENTGWQLEQKVALRNEFTSGPAVPAVHYSGETEGGVNAGIDLEEWS